MKDSFGREITYLRLSVTELCSFRCRYCMPECGVEKKRHEDMLTEDEMISAVKACASLGVTKLRITGGEPLVKKNILSICERSAKVDGIRTLGITTNGIKLPELAMPLKNCGVSRVNISLDTLKADRFSYITRRGNLRDTLAGIDAALHAGFEKVKINTVLIGGFNDDEIRDLASLTQKMPVDVRFIELMPMVDGEFKKTAFISADAVTDALPELEKIPDDGGVARLYKLPGSYGNVGLISPVSSHFCASCNRLRITADGKIRPCLHSPLEYSIKGLDESKMTEIISLAIQAKPFKHGELTYGNMSKAERNMNQIGG